MRRLFGFAVVCICWVSTVWAQSQPKMLQIGWDVYPPMQMLVNDSVKGIDADIATEVVTRAGYQPIFVRMQWVRQLSALEHGELDMVMTASITEDRKPYFVWTAPYRTERVSLLKLASTNASATSLAELMGRKSMVGLIRGSKFDGALGSLQADPRFEELVEPTLTIQNSLDMLRRNRFPFVMDDPDIFLYLAQSQSGESVVEVLRLQSAEVRFMVSKKTLRYYPTVVEDLDKSLEHLKASKGIEPIFARYGLKQ